MTIHPPVTPSGIKSGKLTEPDIKRVFDEVHRAPEQTTVQCTWKELIEFAELYRK
jgi:hypothetical protein